MFEQNILYFFFFALLEVNDTALQKKSFIYINKIYEHINDETLRMKKEKKKSRLQLLMLGGCP